ncbi:MAG: MFS transporter [Pirellula sp.]
MVRFPFRGFVIAATFLLSVLLYVDRVCISIAKSDVERDLSLTNQQMGWVFAAFSLGYALFQTPGGWFADRFGSRRVLAAIVTLWSAFTGLSAVAWSFTSMLTVRFLFGAGEAGAFPAVARTMYSWIPMNERGLVQGINFSGSRIGAAFAYPALAVLIGEFGWRTSFVILMMVGFLWAIAWYLFFRDEPILAKWLPPSELDYIVRTRQDAVNRNISSNASPVIATPLAVHHMFKSPTFWALCGQYFASNFTFFFCLTWLFPRLREQFGLTGLNAGLYASAPLLCGAVGNWFAGWWVDWLYRRQRWILSRRLPAMIGFFLSAVGLIGSVYSSDPLSSSLWFSLCVFGADMTLASSWSSCIDIGGRNAGAVSGTMNMAGNIGSFVTALAFPYLLKWTGSPTPFFFIAASMNIASVFLWMLVDPSRPLNKEEVSK